MLGNDRMIYRRGASQSATFVVAASDSLHQGYADYVCDGVDDQVEIQAAINALSTIGGTIQLTEGRFHISSPIKIEKNAVRLVGAGRSWGNGGTSIILADNSDCNMIEIGKVDVHIFFPTIENLYLNGNRDNQASGHGIDIENGIVSDLTFTNLGINEIKQDGLHFTAIGWLYSLRNVWVEYCDGHGMYCLSGASRCVNCVFMWSLMGIYSGATDVSCINCYISHNEEHGIEFSGGGSLKLLTSVISDNSREASNTYCGARFYNVGTSRSIIMANQFDGNSGELHGVSIHQTSDNIIVLSNSFTGHLSSPVSMDDSSQNANGFVRDNMGFVTENSGTATLLNGTTSITVDHGLDVTPSAGDIMVTPIGSLGSASFFYIDTYTSTQFTIHVNADPGANVDFAWKAIVL